MIMTPVFLLHGLINHPKWRGQWKIIHQTCLESSKKRDFEPLALSGFTMLCDALAKFNATGQQLPGVLVATIAKEIHHPLRCFFCMPSPLIT